MDDWGQWDHYVTFACPSTGVCASVRCLGLRTAEMVAEEKRQLGFVKVQIVHKRFTRKKERQSYVHHGRIHG